MKVSWRTEAPQLLLIAGMFLLAAITWPAAPDRIPVHWNVQGEVDRYGGKVEGLLLVPLLALAVYLLFLVMPRLDPGRAYYARFAHAYTAIRVATLLLMALIYGVLHLILRGHRIDMATVTPLGAGALLVLVGNVMGKIRPNWFVGIRTPWTLSSKTAWTKTHRLGGWLFIAAGLWLFATAVLRAEWAMIVLIGLVVGMAVWTFVYSYLVWRNDPDKTPPAGTLPAETPERRTSRPSGSVEPNDPARLPGRGRRAAHRRKPRRRFGRAVWHSAARPRRRPLPRGGPGVP